MANLDEFEGLRGTILNRNHLPSVDNVVNELLAKEMCKSRVDRRSINKGIMPPSDQKFLV